MIHIVSSFGSGDRFSRAKRSWDRRILVQNPGDKILEIIGNVEDDFVFTNSDSFLVKDTYSILQSYLDEGISCLFSGRYDHPRPLRVPISEEWNRKHGQYYNGHDLFCFSRDSWRRIRPILPDLYLGREGWDWIYLTAILLDGGIKTPETLVAHEMHGTPHWTAYRLSDSRNLHNRKLCAEWVKAYESSIPTSLVTSHPEVKTMLRYLSTLSP